MTARSGFATGRRAGVPWGAGAWALALLVGLPILVVATALVAPGGDTWAHLRATRLGEYVANTVLLAALVGVLSLLPGIATAWLCATAEFPGRRLLSLALVLPLAAPAYVVAYVYTDLLEVAGPVQSALRALTGWEVGAYPFPAVRSLPGAALMLALVLYPYVYLLARAAFSSQSAALFDAARVLGSSPRRAFFGVALPAARPAIAGGLALVLMETVADYGVVDYFGVSTFTTGIFRTWYALGDRGAALKLAAWLFLFVLALVTFEVLSRRGRVSNPLARSPLNVRRTLQGWRRWAATATCAVPVLLGFVVPLAVLLRYTLLAGDPAPARDFAGFALNTFGVAAAAAALATCCALWLSYSERLHPTTLTRAGIRAASLGYALPGAMLALGVIVPLTALDRQLAGFLQSQGMPTGLLLTGTTAALIYAYVARFLTVAFNACHGALTKIDPQLDAVSRSLGAGPGRVLREVHLPLMRPAVLAALLLVFIDVAKELPATLILRPFDFETLATRVYRLASDERLAEASTAALVIVVLGIVPVLLLGAAGGSARRA